MLSLEHRRWLEVKLSRAMHCYKEGSEWDPLLFLLLLLICTFAASIHHVLEDSQGAAIWLWTNHYAAAEVECEIDIVAILEPYLRGMSLSQLLTQESLRKAATDINFLVHPILNSQLREELCESHC